MESTAYQNILKSIENYIRILENTYLDSGLLDDYQNLLRMQGFLNFLEERGKNLEFEINEWLID